MVGLVELLAFLDGAAPWWWIALGVTLGIFEMLTFTYFLIWPGLAALAVGLMMFLSPGLSGQAQMLWFAGLALSFSVAGFYMLGRMRPKPSETPSLNRRSEQLIGRTGEAEETFRNGEGHVVIDGMRWRAHLTTGAAGKGAALRVTGADGMRLTCEPV